MGHFSLASVPFLAAVFSFFFSLKEYSSRVKLVFGELASLRVTVLWQCARQQTTQTPHTQQLNFSYIKCTKGKLSAHHTAGLSLNCGQTVAERRVTRARARNRKLLHLTILWLTNIMCTCGIYRKRKKICCRFALRLPYLKSNYSTCSFFLFVCFSSNYGILPGTLCAVNHPANNEDWICLPDFKRNS